MSGLQAAERVPREGDTLPGFDEFFGRPGTQAQTARDRIAYLQALVTGVPEVLQTLRDDVLPFFSPTAFRGGPEHGWHTVAHARQGFRTRLLPLKKTMLAWASRWHLDGEPWVLEAALATLQRWAAEPPANQVRFSYPPSSVSFALSATEEAAWAHARGSHKSTATWGQLAEQRGHRRVSLKRHLPHGRRRARTSESDVIDRVPYDGRRHFAWLVKRQVLGHTYAQIVEESGVDRLTVLDAVQTAAARLGVRLPAGRRGRPPSRARS